MPRTSMRKAKYGYVVTNLYGKKHSFNKKCDATRCYNASKAVVKARAKRKKVTK